MKRVWKPLDVMRLRLYKVVAAWPDKTRRDGVRREYSVVAADAPREAAQIVADQYKNLPMEHRPDCQGFALQVNQPADWWDGPEAIVSPTCCKHERTQFIQGSEGMGVRERVSICVHCGQITVAFSDLNEKVFRRIEFGLNCDDHLRFAARYMRSAAQAEDALAKATQSDIKDQRDAR